MTILIISHNFEQVLRLSDQVVVMRAGRTVARRQTSETNGQELVGLVTGAVQDPHHAVAHDATPAHDKETAS
jgi:ABC-type sugar transport system ATPase subunit